MNRYISKISYALVFNTLIFSAVVYAESYKDSEGYKDYQKLPDKYKSPEMEEMYKNGYEAEQKKKNFPVVKEELLVNILIKKPIFLLLKI